MTIMKIMKKIMKRNEEENKGKEITQKIEIIEKSSIKTLFLGAVIGVFVITYTNNYLNGSGEGVVFKNLSNKYQSIENGFNSVLINKENVIIEDKKDTSKNHNVFIINYKGSMMATEVEYLKAKIDAIILKANKNDEVIVNMTSPGGVVNGYGLVASQLERLKNAGLKLTATVDTMAASGGYLAAVVADEVIAAPFAYVGSIGVVANVMIYEELLKKIGVTSKVYTSGDSKRTVVPTKMPTKEEEQKLKHELEEIHTQFKNHVLKYRPNVDKKVVFTGQAFLGNEAIKYGLIDKIGTSDDLLIDEFKAGNRLILVSYNMPKKPLQSATKQITTEFVNVIKAELSNSITLQ